MIADLVPESTLTHDARRGRTPRTPARWRELTGVGDMS